MVFAVQCPNAKCRKFMLVEDHARNTQVKCLICKADIKIAAVAGKTPSQKSATPMRLPRTTP